MHMATIIDESTLYEIKKLIPGFAGLVKKTNKSWNGGKIKYNYSMCHIWHGHKFYVSSWI